METLNSIDKILTFHDNSFNFLASLINGNEPLISVMIVTSDSFNFLASLINGNQFFVCHLRSLSVGKAFNFLASLINGNLQEFVH